MTPVELPAASAGMDEDFARQVAEFDFARQAAEFDFAQQTAKFIEEYRPALEALACR